MEFESSNEKEECDDDYTSEDSDYENEVTKSESREEVRGKDRCPECDK